MPNLKFNAALITVAMSSTMAAAGNLETLPIADLQQRAIDNSVTLQTSQWTLTQRADALQVDLLDHAKITTSATTQKKLDTDLPAQTVITVKGDMDLTAQLNISAQTDTEQQTALGITYSPFASDYVTTQEKEQYQLAQLSLTYDQQELLQKLERAVLTVIERNNSLALSQENVALTQAQEKAKRGSLALGVATVSDVAQASQASVNAQQELFTAQVNLLDAQQALYEIVGSEVSVPSLSVTQLVNILEQRTAQLSTYSAQDIQSKQNQQLAIQHSTLTQELNDVGFYNPDIRFTGEYDVDAKAVKLSASFSFSKAQFGAATIMTLDQELQLKSTELMQQQTQVENNYRLLQQKLNLTKAALESRFSDQALYAQDLDEMLLLQQQGERTSLQVAQQRYLKQKADNNVYSALVALYLAQNDLAALWP